MDSQQKLGIFFLVFFTIVALGAAGIGLWLISFGQDQSDAFTLVAGPIGELPAFAYDVIGLGMAGIGTMSAGDKAIEALEYAFPAKKAGRDGK